jgi:hypothetical protein
VLPCCGQLLERHATNLAKGFAAVGAGRRLVEAVDPARDRRVRLLAAARVEARRWLRRLHNVAKHLRVAVVRDHLVDGDDAPRAAITFVAGLVAVCMYRTQSLGYEPGQPRLRNFDSQGAVRALKRQRRAGRARLSLRELSVGSDPAPHILSPATSTNTQARQIR